MDLTDGNSSMVRAGRKRRVATYLDDSIAEPVTKRAFVGPYRKCQCARGSKLFRKGLAVKHSIIKPAHPGCVNRWPGDFDFAGSSCRTTAHSPQPTVSLQTIIADSGTQIYGWQRKSESSGADASVFATVARARHQHLRQPVHDTAESRDLLTIVWISSNHWLA